MHQLVELIREYDEPADHRQGSRDFVLQHGRGYMPAKLPKGMRRGKSGTCYQTCAKFVINPANKGKGFQYVEGFAYHPSNETLIAHAWLAKDGEAFDLTWRDPTGFDNLGCLYFGVEFATKAVGTIVSKRSYFGLLDPVDDLVTSFFTQDAQKAGA